mmetsp:Transcript_1088/g.3258  ORF Transcript_1088/g.3258 Transcript_1088/m.3258 type:complete len:662 (+) Transcript_1088:300-2285(+)
MVRFSPLLLAAVLLALSAVPASSYYLPGTFPQAYPKGSQLQAEVNSLVSFKTELPYDYYSMPFCKPSNGVKKSPKNVNIGTMLTGQKIQNSPYNFTLLVEQKGVSACSEGYYGPMSAEEVNTLKNRIKDNYRVNMILDNLPVTAQDLESNHSVIRPGFDLGFMLGSDYYINNHLVFTILIHPVPALYANGLTLFQAGSFELEGRRRQLLEASDEEDQYTVVGFEVTACSTSANAPDAVSLVCLGSNEVTKDSLASAQKIDNGAKVRYSYDVHWKMSDIKWASRWDSYLKMPRGQVHWFSVINSVIVVLVLSGVVMIILLRTVRRDLVKYEELLGDTDGEFKEEYGWKLVMGDVFRPPPASMALCVNVGTGVQILLCSAVTTIFAALGFLSPASRGALLSTCIGMYILLSVVAGYTAVWMSSMIFQTHERWVSAALRTCFFFPGITVLALTVVNVLLHSTGTVGSIPLKAYFMILALWWLVSTPLGLLGGYLASKQEIPPYPVRTNQIPRHIPPQKVHSIVYFLGGGLLVFGNIFIVLYFTMTSMWQGYFYYLFGFVLVAGLLTCIITAQVSVVATYLQLCTEDYRWWWTSFARGGSVAVYVAVYAISFLVSTLHNLHGLSVVVYLCYMGILSYGLFLTMGTVGFLASYYFVFKIFASVKSD